MNGFRPGRSTGRLIAAVFLLLLALAPGLLLAWRSRHLEHLGYFHDDGMYWIAGKSLAQGTGYRILSLPGAPYQTKYPPGLPLLLSLVWRACPEYPANLPWAMLLMAAMLPAFAWVSAGLLESWGCSRPAAILVGAWMVLNPYVVFFGMSLMPELLVTALVGCCLIGVRKAAERESCRMALLAGVLAGLACLTKTAAMPLLGAGLIWFALRRKFRLAAWFGAVPLASLVVWSVWSARHTMPSHDVVTIYYTSYLGDFLFDLRRWEWVSFFWQNIPGLLTSIGNLLIPDMADVPLLGENFSRVLGLLTIGGIVRRMRREGVGPEHWFAAGFCLLMLVWQYRPNERLLIPILPILAYGALTELRHVAALMGAAWRSGKSGPRVAAAGVAAVLATVCLWACAMVAAGHQVLLPTVVARYRAQLESNRNMYQWINRHLAPAEALLTNHDAAAFLYAGREAMRLPNFPKQCYRQDRQTVARAFAELPSFARSHGIRYLMLGQTDLDLDSFVKGIVDWNQLTSRAPYRLLAEEPMARLYEIEPPK